MLEPGLRFAPPGTEQMCVRFTTHQHDDPYSKLRNLDQFCPRLSECLYLARAAGKWMHANLRQPRSDSGHQILQRRRDSVLCPRCCRARSPADVCVSVKKLYWLEVTLWHISVFRKCITAVRSFHLHFAEICQLMLSHVKISGDIWTASAGLVLSSVLHMTAHLMIYYTQINI